MMRLALSRDSQVVQRILASLCIESSDGIKDGFIEGVCIVEGLMREVMAFEVAPDPFDVIEFGRVFRQPFDGEPVRVGCKRRVRRLTDMDRAVVEDDNNGVDALAGLGAVNPVERFQEGDEIGGALGAGGGDDEFALSPVKGAPSWPLSAIDRALQCEGLLRALPRPAPDRDASTPRSHRRRAG